MAQPKQRANPDSIAAGAAGASSGTLLLLVLNDLPDSVPIKTFLVLLAPTISVVVHFLWKWASAEVKRRSLEREIKASIRSTLQIIDRQLADVSSSPTQREVLQRTKEALQSKEVDIQLQRIATLSEALALGDTPVILSSQDVTTTLFSVQPAVSASLLGLVPSNTPAVQVADKSTS
jgi:hypothetical protein